MRFRARVAVACSLVPLSYGLLVACGGDDTTPANVTDGGGSDATTDSGSKLDAAAPDSSHSDSGNVIDAGPMMNFVAINSLVAVSSSIQMCFVASATGTPGVSDGLAMSPQPTTPLAPGLLSTINVPSVVGQNVRVFTYYTSSLTAFGLTGASCQDLLSQSIVSETATIDGGVDAGDAGIVARTDAGAGTLIQTVDFDVSEVLPASLFTSATAKYLILPTGCPSSSNLAAFGDPYYCGNPNDAGVPQYFGDFHTFAFQLDSSHGDAGTARVQGLIGTPVQYQGFPPFELGFTYSDAGAPTDGGAPGTFLDGPVDPGSFNPPATSAPLPTGTDVPSLTGASNGFYFLAPPISFLQTFPISQVLSTSNLTTADLAGQSFTLVLVGDGALPASLADGGANPLIGLRLIRNDTP